MKKLMQGLLVVLGMSLVGVSLTQAPTAQAAKVGKVSKVTKAPYHATQGTIYTSTKLNKVQGKAKSYLHVTLYVTKHATLKQNGKKKVFYYVNTKQVKGWMWRGYLKNGKAIPSVASMNPAMAREFVTQTNRYRTAKGMQPVKLDSAIMAVLKDHQSWLKKSGTGYETDWPAYYKIAGKQGLSTDSSLMTYSETDSKRDLKNSQNLAQFGIDTAMIVGNRQPDYANADILQPDVSRVGVFWFASKGGAYVVYMVV